MQNIMSSSPSTPRLDRVNLEKEYLYHMVLKVPFGRIFRWLEVYTRYSLKVIKSSASIGKLIQNSEQVAIFCKIVAISISSTSSVSSKAAAAT